MAYSRAFFAFQLTFAQQLATKFQLPLADVIEQYTTFTKSFGRDGWDQYIAGLAHSADPVAWTYQWYWARRAPEPSPQDNTFAGHALFGCFYYVLRDEGVVVRPHFLKNDLPGLGPLGRERSAVRQSELRAMFTHIRKHEPQAQIVLGNSWLYNLDAYRRLFPPVYTDNLPSSEYDEFQFLALWGQCFDRDWQPKADVTKELLHRVEALTHLSELRRCFPYQIRRPQCEIAAFYRFYDFA